MLISNVVIPAQIAPRYENDETSLNGPAATCAFSQLTVSGVAYIAGSIFGRRGGSVFGRHPLGRLSVGDSNTQFDHTYSGREQYLRLKVWALPVWALVRTDPPF